jgi:site-specific recombinase XerD
VPGLPKPETVITSSCITTTGRCSSRRAGKRSSSRPSANERGGPLTTRAVHKIVARAGEVAELTFPVHPHMLRHAKGYQLAQRGIDTRAIQGYLGHRDIKSTVVYTQLDPSRFRGFERD